MKKEFKKKLSLNKLIVAKINEEELAVLKGGYYTDSIHTNYWWCNVTANYCPSLGC